MAEASETGGAAGGVQQEVPRLATGGAAASRQERDLAGSRLKPSVMLSVLYQDDDLLVVDKPSGLVVHRGWARDGEVVMTLARALASRHVSPVHRLDRGTSGVLVLALTAAAAGALGEAFESGRVQKRYLALVRGIAPEAGIVDHPIPRAPGGPRVPAITRYRRLATFERYSWLEAFPETGRLHQVRRHLKHISHPVIGDVRYGKGEHNRLFRTRFGLYRLALHAAELSFEHPVSGAPSSFEAPLPADLSGPLAAMGLAPPAAARGAGAGSSRWTSSGGAA
ncbi:MAG TPA: pseudouridine synthase [Thermoanaerobaculia bacterium]|nr:pseudouridine synthase [Thermoanaerobaculia bacterium]